MWWNNIDNETSIWMFTALSFLVSFLARLSDAQSRSQQRYFSINSREMIVSWTSRSRDFFLPADGHMNSKWKRRLVHFSPSCAHYVSLSITVDKLDIIEILRAAFQFRHFQETHVATKWSRLTTQLHQQTFENYSLQFCATFFRALTCFVHSISRDQTFFRNNENSARPTKITKELEQDRLKTMHQNKFAEENESALEGDHLPVATLFMQSRYRVPSSSNMYWPLPRTIFNGSDL